MNVINFITKHGYDGVDVDWEFPANPEEKASYSLLIRDLRKAGDKLDRQFLLTMAISAGTWSHAQNDYAELRKYVDWYNVMTYDYHGNWTMHAVPPRAHDGLSGIGGHHHEVPDG